ncbi:MAG: UDP-N-acetylmuramoyl-tripeptide--D-alanyl-D-alanine ligase, partial [Thermodesulfobacteriota bacterium]|nr:UDP-N-acetylmuramoyl-tripeptide--D-alanyl-D-alanine ligase [Thermodesulfobacteriota bacterium]
MFKVNDVIKATGGKIIKDMSGITFSGVSLDSRTINPGELFIAVRGRWLDGHDFAENAFKKGAKGILVENNSKIIPRINKRQILIIGVNDTIKALGDLAHYHRKRFKIPVIAVTGSNGKTTTKELIANILEVRYKTLKNPGNLNNHFGLPLSLLKLNADHNACVLEIGMNQKGEIANLTRILEPDIGIITNIGPVHLEFFRDIREVAFEKAALFKGLTPFKTIIVNKDDIEIEKHSKFLPNPRVTFGFSEEAQVKGRNIREYKSGTISFYLERGGERQRVGLNLMGKHNVYNALAAAACVTPLDFTLKEIEKGLKKIRPIEKRMEPIRIKNSVTLINDSYNANPASTMNSLQTLAKLKKERAIAVLGDMLELGKYSKEA